jgi:hypothetical protein
VELGRGAAMGGRPYSSSFLLVLFEESLDFL